MTAPVKNRVAPGASQAGRRAAIQATATATPSSASTKRERGERDGRMDERPAGDVDGRDQRGEGEQDRGIDEERPEVRRPPARPAADDHQRREEDAAHQRAVDHHGRDEPADPRREQRPDAHAEEVVEGGRRRDAVPLVDGADEQDAAGRGGRRERAEDRELARPPRAP